MAMEAAVLGVVDWMETIKSSAHWLTVHRGRGRARTAGIIMIKIIMTIMRIMRIPVSMMIVIVIQACGGEWWQGAVSGGRRR